MNTNLRHHRLTIPSALAVAGIALGMLTIPVKASADDGARNQLVCKRAEPSRQAMGNGTIASFRRIQRPERCSSIPYRACRARSWVLLAGAGLLLGIADALNAGIALATPPGESCRPE